MRPAYPFRIIQRPAAGGDWTTDATSLLTGPKGGGRGFVKGFLHHDRVTVFSRTEDACETVTRPRAGAGW